MKKLLLRRAILVANSSLLAMGMMACGGNKNNNNTSTGIDSGSGTPDTSTIDGPVVPTCTTTALGAQGFEQAADDGSAITWGGSVTTDLGGGGGGEFAMEFYSIGDDLTASIDLSAGDQNNYATCSACFRVFELDGTGAVVKQFFQDGGTLKLAIDPITNNHLMGTVTDLSLVEVTLADPDNGDFTSTPVVGGTCLSVGTVTLEADLTPAGWTCAHAAFNDGANCDCSCGAHDPDCDIAAAPIVGCTGTQTCAADVCTDTCNVLSTPPVGCSAAAGVCGYENDTTDICYSDATLVDPAILGGACASTSPLFCAVVNTVATGLCDQFIAVDSACRKACDANSDCAAPNPQCTPIPGLTVKGICTPAAPANDKCQGAPALTIGTPVNGDSTFAASNYDAGLETATCTNFSQPGPDLAYKITLTAGQAITATLTNVGANFDPSLSILGPGGAAAICDANPVNCLAGADSATAGVGETLAFTATTAGTYFIIVDSFGTPGGAFTLTVTNSP